MADYTVKRSMLGKSNVHYTCAKCQASLSAPLESAGAREKCPQCGVGHAVPGVVERDAHEKDRAEAEQRKAEQAREASRRRSDEEDAQRRRVEAKRAEKIEAERDREQRRKSAPPVDAEQVPKYLGLEWCATIARFVGGICLVAAGVLLVCWLVALLNSEFTSIMYIVWALGAGLTAALYYGAANVLEAMRDIAINSWYQRMAITSGTVATRELIEAVQEEAGRFRRAARPTPAAP